MKIIVTLLVLFSAVAHAQSWPTKPVRIIVAFAPGGSLDFVTRIVAERLSQDLGQQFLVENRAGANGNVALDTYTEWKSIYVDFSGRLQRAQIDNQPS